MTAATTTWVCSQDLGPYPSLEPAETYSAPPTVRFTADTARRFADDTARLAIYTGNDTPVLREHDGGFDIIDAGQTVGRRHIRVDGSVTLGRPWQWQACAVDADGRLWRPYTATVTVIALYSVPDTADALYPIVAASDDTEFGSTWEPRLDYGDANEVKLACARPVDDRRLRWCLRRPGHPGSCATTPDR